MGETGVASPGDGSQPVRRVVFSLGSNVCDRLAYLQGGFDGLRGTPGVKVEFVSRVYETVAVGEPQPDFLNVVVVAQSGLAPSALLERALELEKELGRPPGHRPGPRTLDVDLVTVGGLRLQSQRLILPHPRAHQRAFVLIPWLELDPEAELPGHGPVAELIGGVDASGVRLTDLVMRQ